MDKELRGQTPAEPLEQHENEELQMVAAAKKLVGSLKGPKVGRKRQPIPKDLLKTPSGKFAVRLQGLMEAAGLDADSLGDKIGKSGDSVRLYLTARAVPHLDDWPKLAKALGVSHYRDLIAD